MDARPILERVAKVLHEHGLEATLIGSVVKFHRIRIEFLVQNAPGYVGKLKRTAKSLNAVLFRQIYPPASAWSIMRDEDGPQLRFRVATREQQLAALKAESDRELMEMIRRNLAKPIHERTHFLRKRVGICATCL